MGCCTFCAHTKIVFYDASENACVKCATFYYHCATQTKVFSLIGCCTFHAHSSTYENRFLWCDRLHENYSYHKFYKFISRIKVTKNAPQFNWRAMRKTCTNKKVLQFSSIFWRFSLGSMDHHMNEKHLDCHKICFFVKWSSKVTQQTCGVCLRCACTSVNWFSFESLGLLRSFDWLSSDVFHQHF